MVKPILSPKELNSRGVSYVEGSSNIPWKPFNLWTNLERGSRVEYFFFKFSLFEPTKKTKQSHRAWLCPKCIFVGKKIVFSKDWRLPPVTWDPGTKGNLFSGWEKDILTCHGVSLDFLKNYGGNTFKIWISFEQPNYDLNNENILIGCFSNSNWRKPKTVMKSFLLIWRFWCVFSVSLNKVKIVH